MNPALIYLQWTLLKRKGARFVLSLRQPGTFLCVATLTAFGAALVYNSDDPAFDRLFKAGTLTALLSIWLVACTFKGFLQGGIIFTPSDVEYLIPAPFRLRELICFRLLSPYLISLLSSLVFFALARRRFEESVWVTIDFVIFQIVCAHLAMTVSLFAGRLSFPAFVRVRRGIFVILIFAGAISLNVVLPLKFLPEFLAAWLGRMGRDLPQPAIHSVQSAFAHPMAAAFFLSGLISAAWFQVAWVKEDLAETLNFRDETGGEAGPEAGPSKLRTSSDSAGKRFRNPYPQFCGARVLIWKHLLNALRTRRELFYAALVTIAYVGAVKIALDHDLVDFSGAMATGRVSGEEYSHWTTLAVTGAIIWIGFLGLLLQRILPFDFRSDGHRIDDLRVLPFSPLSVALVELAVPVPFALLFQLAAVAFLWCSGKFPTSMIWLSLLAFTVMNIGLAAMGNIFCLLFASKVGNSQSGGVLGAFLLVALSLSALAPAIGTYVKLSRSAPGLSALFGAIFVQCVIDGFVILALAKVFQRCELSRELQ